MPTGSVLNTTSYVFVLCQARQGSYKYYTPSYYAAHYISSTEVSLLNSSLSMGIARLKGQY